MVAQTPSVGAVGDSVPMQCRFLHQCSSSQQLSGLMSDSVHVAVHGWYQLVPLAGDVCLLLSVLIAVTAVMC